MRIVKISAEEALFALWSPTKTYKGSDGGRYMDYYLLGDPKLGITTVELDKKNGYRIRNIFVSKEYQRKGYASAIHQMMNQESLAVTGKPLRSSEIGYAKERSNTTTSPEGEALWESFVNKNLAKKEDGYYQFLPPKPKGWTAKRLGKASKKGGGMVAWEVYYDGQFVCNTYGDDETAAIGMAKKANPKLVEKINSGLPLSS